MTTTLKAHFDGKVLVPDEPVNIPMDCALRVHVEPVEKQPTEPPANDEPSVPDDERPLMKLVRLLESLPDNPDTPTDGAAQHDHYLYGHPKRP